MVVALEPLLDPRHRVLVVGASRYFVQEEEEFLLAKARSKNAGITVAETREKLRRHWVDADRRNDFVSRLMRERQGRLIALLEVEPKPERNLHIGRIAQLDGFELSVPDELAAEYPELLYGGLWGTCALTYDPTTNPKRPQIRVTEFTPYQLTRPSMDVFKRARGEFSTEEWIEVLITSAGYRPEAFTTLRQRLLLLSRLVPLVQPNVNLIELGPRGTGKSYLLRNLSPRVYLIAGARATPAALLYDLQKKSVGVVGRKKVVVFDEIGATHFPDRSLVAALKDFMESGTISRGGRSLVSDCSLVFTGNLDLGADGRPRREYLHLFEALPKELADTAVGDRMHGFLPGWELPKISDDVLADGGAPISSCMDRRCISIGRSACARSPRDTAHTFRGTPSACSARDGDGERPSQPVRVRDLRAVAGCVAVLVARARRAR